MSETELKPQVDVAVANATALKPEKPEATDDKKKKKKTWQQELLEWIVTIVAAVLIAFVVRSFIFEPVYVDGDSMYPTLHDGEIMYVSKTAYGTSFIGIPFTNIGTYFTVGGTPERFDVVVCHYDEENYNVVKRVVGLPGDTVELRGGYLYVNGIRYTEKFLHERPYADFGPVTVEEGRYFLMGDNRNNSNDSRNSAVGAVDREMIKGHVLSVLWHEIPSTLEDYNKK